MEWSLQGQIELESKDRRSNVYRIAGYVQEVYCGLVSDTTPAF
jgi:hypothetical protein